MYAGEDFDAEDDSADLTHTVRGGDYTGVLARNRHGGVWPITTSMIRASRWIRANALPMAILKGGSDSYTIRLTTKPTALRIH